MQREREGGRELAQFCTWAGRRPLSGPWCCPGGWWSRPGGPVLKQTEKGKRSISTWVAGVTFLVPAGADLWCGGPLLRPGGPLLWRGGPLLWRGGPLLWFGGPLLRRSSGQVLSGCWFLSGLVVLSCGLVVLALKQRKTQVTSKTELA